MPTLYDYLEWRGDVTLAERSFNDVDALILATVAYIDFSGVMGADGTMALADAARGVLDEVGGDLSPRVRSMATLDARFLRLVGESARLGGAMVRGVVDRMDPERTLQFAAMEFALEDGSTYVAFRGTDLTLAGWHEDFMLSFAVTDAQRLASAYLERALRDAARDGRRVVVGGHSKGGNLVSYAVATCPRELLGTIERAYSFDGPGTAPELLTHGAYDLLGERYLRIEPEYSVIGALFERAGEPRRYVRSCARGMLQHDPTTWEVTRDAFVPAEGLAPEAALFNQATAEWIEATPFAQRADLTEELFSILGAGGAQALPEVFQAPGVQQVLAAAGSASEESRRLVTRLAETMVSMTLDAARVATRSALDGAVAGATEAAQSAYGTAAQGAAELAKKIAARREGRRREAQGTGGVPIMIEDEPQPSGDRPLT